MNPELNDIVAMLQDNHLHAAEQACNKYLSRRKGDADGWFVHAGIQSRLGKLERVIESCKKVLKLQPAHAGATFNIGAALQALRRHRDAIPYYEQCLALQPENQSARTGLTAACNEEGIRLFHAGATTEAARYCKRALELTPDYANAYNILGLIADREHDSAQAEAHLRKALQLDPKHVSALNNLATLYAGMDRNQQAVDLYRHALTINPDYFDAWNNLGLGLLHMRDLEGASAAFTHAIRCNPASADAHNNAGNARLALGDYRAAVEHLRTAVKLNPAFAKAFNNLGNALLMLQIRRENYSEAERCYHKALALEPDLAEAWLNLGISLHSQAKYAEALEHYNQALRQKPGYEDALAARSSALEHLGRFDEALTAVQPLIDAGSTNINVAIAWGALAKRYQTTGQAIALLEHIIDDRLDSRNPGDAHFLLGKLYDDCERYEQAFHQYELANAINPPPYRHADIVRRYRQLAHVFTREHQVSRPHASNESELPVFIVGMPRSGTSLVEQILSSHPEVYGAGELEDIGDIPDRFSSEMGALMPYPDCLNIADAQAFDRIANRYLETLRKLGGEVLRVTDKMPHNFQAMGMIERLFPKARVIHCQRDPIDTCLSIWSLQFNVHHAYSYSLHDLGIYYRQYQRLMAYWAQTLHLPIMDVSYETLIDNQERVSRQMIDFIGLEWDDNCLQFHKSERVVATFSYDQVRQPIHRKSLHRWKNYQPWISPLIDALQDDSADW